MNKNLVLYNKIFCDLFQVSLKDLNNLKMKESEGWDSVGHISLISTLEEKFNIDFDPEDMFMLTTYEKGINILREKYNINFDDQL